LYISGNNSNYNIDLKKIIIIISIIISIIKYETCFSTILYHISYFLYEKWKYKYL